MAGFVLVGIVTSTSSELSFMYGWRSGINCRSGLISLVFAKSLRIDLGTVSLGDDDDSGGGSGSGSGTAGTTAGSAEEKKAPTPAEGGDRKLSRGNTLVP